jgi:ABC-type multidrug transport system ATPase subunit
MDVTLPKLAAGLRGGLRVIFNTHYMDEAEELSDRIAIIDDGQVRLEPR